MASGRGEAVWRRRGDGSGIKPSLLVVCTRGQGVLNQLFTVDVFPSDQSEKADNSWVLFPLGVI